MGNMYSRFRSSKAEELCVDLSVSEDDASTAVVSAVSLQREITNTELILAGTSCSSLSDAMADAPDQHDSNNELVEVGDDSGNVEDKVYEEAQQQTAPEKRKSKRIVAKEKAEEAVSKAQAAAVANKQATASKKHISEDNKSKLNQQEMRMKHRIEFARAADLNRKQAISKEQQQLSDAKEINETMEKITESPRKLAKTKPKATTKSRGKPGTRSNINCQDNQPQTQNEASTEELVELKDQENNDKLMREQTRRKRSAKTNNVEISIPALKARKRNNQHVNYDGPSTSQQAQHSSNCSLTKLLAQIGEEEVNKSEVEIAAAAGGGDNQLATTSTSTSLSLTELLLELDKHAPAISDTNVSGGGDGN